MIDRENIMSTGKTSISQQLGSIIQWSCQLRPTEKVQGIWIASTLEMHQFLKIRVFSSIQGPQEKEKLRIEKLIKTVTTACLQLQHKINTKFWKLSETTEDYYEFMIHNKSWNQQKSSA